MGGRGEARDMDDQTRRKVQAFITASQHVLIDLRARLEQNAKNTQRAMTADVTDLRAMLGSESEEYAEIVALMGATLRADLSEASTVDWLAVAYARADRYFTER
jgi:hypothetical protein